MYARTALALCLLMPVVASAQHANDTCATASVIAPTEGFAHSRSATIVPFPSASLPEMPMSCAVNAQNTIWYSFTPTESGRYEIASCDTLYLDTSLDDFAMAIYEGPCGALVELANGCNDDWCSTRPRLVVDLVAGVPYSIQIGRFEAPSDANDVIQLQVTRTSGADSCVGPVPDLPLNTTVQVSTIDGEANDSQVGGGAACYPGVGQTTTLTTLEATRRDRVHRFTAPRTAAYTFRAGASVRSYDPVLYVTDSCVAATTPPHIYSPPQCLSGASRLASATVSQQEEVVCLPLTLGQQVYVWVDEGVVQPTATFGGSLPLVATECAAETANNNTPATASPLSCGVTGAIEVAADVDFYALGAPQAGDRLFAMVEAAAANINTVLMRVTTDTSTVEYDTSDLDTDYGGSAPGVAGTPLTAVPHFISVANDSTTTVMNPYHVYSVIQSGTPVSEVEPNGTPETATSAGSNYFTGSVADLTDVDFYAFQARAGDLVYLALDSSPGRTGGTPAPNFTLSLWDATGEQVFINDGTTTVGAGTGSGLTATGPTSPSEHLLYRVRKSGTFWARVARSTAVTTANIDYILSISLNCGTGGGFGAPTLTGLTPTAGTSLGGELVTLTGTNFGPGSVVTFEGNAATNVSATPTELVVRTPVSVDGAADVTVTNRGQTPATLPDAFTFTTPIAPPTVTSVTPSEGPLAGGQLVTVRGTLFKSGAEVRFDVGGVVQPGTSVTVTSLTELTVVTPAHVEGDATVTVRNPVDALEGGLAAAYRYNAAPVITQVTPNTGLVSGGTVVTIQGSSFRPGASVRFGASAGLAVTIDPSGTSLTVETPASAQNGPVDVVVVNPDAQQVTRVDGFRYLLPGPTLTAVTPASGPSAGGTLLTLTGTNFFASPTVLVNDVPAVNVTRVSATQVTAATPPGTPGVVNVVLANTDGQEASLVAAFAYVAPPGVTAISPTNGPSLGGTRITITGADFQPGLTVRIGGSPAFGAVMTTPNTVTAITPSSMAGLADVEVQNPDGQRGLLADAFTFDGAPALSALSPTVGSTAGGTVVTLTGTGFLAGAEVIFGTQPSSQVTVVSPTTLTAVAPAAPMSVVGVTVRNADGQTVNLSSAFRYVDAPVVSSVSPNMGNVSGGTVVRLTGVGFGAQTTVKFGDLVSPLVTQVNPTQLDAVTPAHAPGVVDVSVSNPDGATMTLPQSFTFTRSAPTISAVAPASGPIAGGTMLAISGSGFAANVTVTLGGEAVTDVVVASPELLRGRAPAHVAGQVDVVVTNDDGQAATASNAYTYVAPVDGNMGVADGGTGGLGEPPDAGTGTTEPTGCGCSGVEGGTLLFAAIGLLLRRRRPRG